MCVYLNISKERSIVTIYDVGMGQQDLTDSANFAIMKGYVPILLCGTTLPNPAIVSCKDQSWGLNIYIYIWQHPRYWAVVPIYISILDIPNRAARLYVGAVPSRLAKMTQQID